ncbi:MAG: sulfotransferase [Pseudomonadota bacterium]
MGNDTNPALDNLWFTLLFVRREILDVDSREFERCFEIFASATLGNRLSPEVKRYLAALVTDSGRYRSTKGRARIEGILTAKGRPAGDGPWGWKEPNTHIVLPRLLKLWPDLKYIHVMRNGLDMAYSRNQRQARFWGRAESAPGAKIGPEESLRFWCRAHAHIVELAAEFPGSIEIVRLEDVCDSPETSIGRMAMHAGLSVSSGDIGRLARLVERPESIGRFRDHDLSGFAAADLKFVRQMGFDTGESS